MTIKQKIDLAQQGINPDDQIAMDKLAKKIRTKTNTILRQKVWYIKRKLM